MASNTRASKRRRTQSSNDVSIFLPPADFERYPLYSDQCVNGHGANLPALLQLAFDVLPFRVQIGQEPMVERATLTRTQKEALWTAAYGGPLTGERVCAALSRWFREHPEDLRADLTQTLPFEVLSSIMEQAQDVPRAALASRTMARAYMDLATRRREALIRNRPLALRAAATFLLATMLARDGSNYPRSYNKQLDAENSQDWIIRVPNVRYRDGTNGEASISIYVHSPLPQYGIVYSQAVDKNRSFLVCSQTTIRHSDRAVGRHSESILFSMDNLHCLIALLSEADAIYTRSAELITIVREAEMTWSKLVGIVDYVSTTIQEESKSLDDEESDEMTFTRTEAFLNVGRLNENMLDDPDLFVIIQTFYEVAESSLKERVESYNNKRT